MILVTGATGNLGSATLEFLLQKLPASQVAGLARSAEKAAPLRAKGIDIRLGDYTDHDSLVAAFTGVDKLFLVASNNQQGQIGAQHVNVIAAAKAAGVRHIAYTNGDIKDPDNTALAWRENGHRMTREALMNSGIPYTLFQNTLYAEVLPYYLDANVLDAGISYPAGNGRVPFATRRDMAEASATLLARQEPLQDRYILASETAYSFADLAQILSELAGKPVVYHNLDAAAYKAKKLAAGVPEHMLGHLMSFGQAIAAGDLDTGHTDLPAILGRQPTPLREYLKSVYFPQN